MKNIALFVLSIILFSCNSEHKGKTKSSVAKKRDTAYHDLKYTDQQLEAFLDSVGKLPRAPLVKEASFYADSIFNSREQLKQVFSKADIALLKKAVKAKYLNRETAKRMFGKFEVSTAFNDDSTFFKGNKVHISKYGFDQRKNGWNEFAICLCTIGGHAPQPLYFFKNDTLISKHQAYHHYGLELKHYRDADGKTVVYYTESYTTGSGIGWFTYNFYKYDGAKLLPILNLLENGISIAWSEKSKFLETTIQKTNPLTVKMVYYQQFYKFKTDSDKVDLVKAPDFINDSTEVTYLWDDKTKKLKGQYQQSKLSEAEILTYNLSNNELLFINIYHQRLKEGLKDKLKRNGILEYLRSAKNWDNFLAANKKERQYKSVYLN